jgi:Flp pilus assembly pilin Flp
VIETLKRYAGMVAKRRITRRRSHSAAWRKRHHRRRGMTAIEYCFMLSLIMLALLFAVQHLGTTLKSSVENSDTKLQTYMPAQ